MPQPSGLSTVAMFLNLGNQADNARLAAKKTAVLVSNDALSSVLDTLRRNGFVLGYENVSWTVSLEPPVTTRPTRTIRLDEPVT